MSTIFLTFEREHRASLMLFLVVGGGLLCFLSMAETTSLVEETTVGDGIRNGSMFHIAMAISISLAVPVLMNLMVDIGLDNFGKDAKKSKISKATTNDKDIMTNVEKFIFMLGIVIFPVVSCFTDWTKAILLASCASSVAVTSIFVIFSLPKRCIILCHFHVHIHLISLRFHSLLTQSIFCFIHFPHLSFSNNWY